MRFLFLILVPIFLLMVAPANAQDPLVQKALGRIAKVETAEASMAAGDKQKAQKLLSDLNWAEKRLKAVVQQGTPEWKGADKRLKAARVKVNAKANKAKPAPKPAPAPEPAPVPQPTPGSGPKPAPTPAPAPAYDHAKLVQLNKEVGNAWNNLKIVPVRLLQDSNRVKMVQKEIEGFRSRLSAFPSGDSNVKLVTANLNDFEGLLNGSLEKLNGDRSQAADIEKRIKEIQARYDRKALPASIDVPFREGQVRAWARQMRELREKHLPADLAWVQSIAGNAAIEQNLATSLNANLQGSATRSLDGIEKGVRERIAGNLEAGLYTANWVLETDPQDRHHILNRILGKGAFDGNMKRLREAEDSIAIAIVYDQAMGAPCVMGPTGVNVPEQGKPDRAAQAKTIQSAIAHLKKCAESALDEVRMPKADSEDPALLKIAAETLKLKKYEVKGWERMVINSKKRHQEKREAWISSGSVSSTISFYNYSWDQFQVTTAEKHGEEIWLYSNLLKHYYSGDSTTPVDQWILSKRFELTRILPENLDKPPLPETEVEPETKPETEPGSDSEGK